MAWLKSFEWSVEEDRRIFESVMRLIEHPSKEISASSRVIEERYKKDKDAQLLGSIWCHFCYAEKWQYFSH